MDKTSYKIAVVGNRDTILPFKLIGFQTFPVKEAQETINTLRRLAREDFGIIYLTEDMAADIPETLAYYDQLEIPALVLIPTASMLSLSVSPRTSMGRICIRCMARILLRICGPISFKIQPKVRKNGPSC